MRNNYLLILFLCLFNLKLGAISFNSGDRDSDVKVDIRTLYPHIDGRVDIKGIKTHPNNPEVFSFNVKISKQSDLFIWNNGTVKINIGYLDCDKQNCNSQSLVWIPKVSSRNNKDVYWFVFQSSVDSVNNIYLGSSDSTIPLQNITKGLGGESLNPQLSTTGDTLFFINKLKLHFLPGLLKNIDSLTNYPKLTNKKINYTNFIKFFGYEKEIYKFQIISHSNTLVALSKSNEVFASNGLIINPDKPVFRLSSEQNNFVVLDNPEYASYTQNNFVYLLKRDTSGRYLKVNNFAYPCIEREDIVRVVWNEETQRIFFLSSDDTHNKILYYNPLNGEKQISFMADLGSIMKDFEIVTYGSDCRVLYSLDDVRDETRYLIKVFTFPLGIAERKITDTIIFNRISTWNVIAQANLSKYNGDAPDGRFSGNISFGFLKTFNFKKVSPGINMLIGISSLINNERKFMIAKISVLPEAKISIVNLFDNELTLSGFVEAGPTFMKVSGFGNKIFPSVQAAVGLGFFNNNVPNINIRVGMGYEKILGNVDGNNFPENDAVIHSFLRIALGVF